MSRDDRHAGDEGARADTLLAADTSVGDFRLLRFLGEGAMGQVYLAMDTTLGRLVALKFIKGSVLRQHGAERFLEEARATARLNHPHIVTLHAFGVHDGRPYLALEYIDGRSLRALLESGPLPLGDALRYCRAAAEGVAEAHRRGLVHADLKPENIVIPRDGRVRVVDFGVAKLVGGAPAAASGTPAYMAPERWHGAPPTGAIDVWSLGVTLHELIAGRRPIADAALQRLPFATSLLELLELPAAPWAELVRDCLALEPAARPTAEELARRLAGLLEGPAAAGGADARAAGATTGLPTVRAAPLARGGGAPSEPGTGGERAVRIDYDIERRRHEGFVGRAALLARLDQLLLADEVDRWVVVTGGPGMGKSALLAAWLDRREAAGVAVPHHFIRRGEYDWDDPTRLVGSLVAQLEARFPALGAVEVDAQRHPAARLAAALARVSAKALAPRGERLVVLIDGLDEYDPPATGYGDPLAAFLPHALPRGVSFLCASRPRHPHLPMLEARDGALVRIDLDEPDLAADNDATVRLFWERAAPPLGLDAGFVGEAVAHAGGNLQHAVTLRKHLAGVPAARRRALDIPRGLEALIAKSWERIASDPLAERGLGILCAAREALTLDELGAVAGWADEHRQQRQAFLRTASELLVETRREDDEPEYRLHHDAIRAHVARALGTAVLRGHHAALAERLATWPPPGDAAMRRYALRHALNHRVEAADREGAWRIAADLAFLEAKCRELGAEDAEADAARAAERCRARGDEAIGRRFDDLARALVRESHWLRDAPEATAALVWNRLRRSGWSAEDIDEELRVPAGAAFLRVRHGATRESPALVRDLVGHAGWVTACAVTPDGRRAVSASSDQTLKIWDLAGGRALATFVGHAGEVTACAVTPDGQRVISASRDQTLKVWELESGRVLATFEARAGWVTACAVTPDGRRVIAATGDRALRVWDLERGCVLATLEGHAGWVTACAVTPDGQRVISADDRALKVWDLERGRALATFAGDASGVTACAVTLDGQRVVSAWGRTLKVRDASSGRVLATFEGHTDRVTACVVTPDGGRVISASWDRTLKVWELESGRVLATFEGHAGWATACAVTPDGRRVISASADRKLKLWDVGQRGLLAAFEGHVKSVTACAVTPDGGRVVSASADRTLKVWDAGSGRVLATFKGHGGEPSTCAVTPDGARLISASSSGRLKIWDLARGRVFTTLEGHGHGVTACAVTPDGGRVVSASWDRTLKVWDLERGCAIATLDGHADRVTACAVPPDGRRVISASADGTLKIWELEGGRALATLEGHGRGVTACAVTPDGRRVISASADGTLKVWELEGGRALATFAGHAGDVIACAVTPDGRRVVSASRDQTLRVWDLDTHACLVIHRGDAPYTAVVATATGVVAGDVVGTVWFLDHDTEVAARRATT